MIRNICKDELFLARKAAPALPEDLPIAQDLLETLIAHKDGCVGMAANMIGVAKRIIAFESEDGYLVMFNPVILNKSENCGGQRGPGVSAVMRLAAFASSALNGAEVGEAATVGAFQNFYYLMFVCLVKGYEYGLHWVLE